MQKKKTIIGTNKDFLMQGTCFNHNFCFDLRKTRFLLKFAYNPINNQINLNYDFGVKKIQTNLNDDKNLYETNFIMMHEFIKTPMYYVLNKCTTLFKIKIKIKISVPLKCLN